MAMRLDLARRATNAKGVKGTRRSRGFTLLEVMMALTILGLGLIGVVGLQRATIVGNQDAQQLSIASGIARTWIERLQRDATRWNHPSAIQTASDIGTDTAWLRLVPPPANPGPSPASAWFVPPVPPAPFNVSELVGTVASATDAPRTASAAFDLNGNDVPIGDPRAVYCTHLRLRYVYPDALIRAEVRVFWTKRQLATPTAFATLGLAGGICAPNPVVIGGDDLNFHWVYAATAISKVSAQ